VTKFLNRLRLTSAAIFNLIQCGPKAKISAQWLMGNCGKIVNFPFRLRQLHLENETLYPRCQPFAPTRIP
jgi:hypothetical protein